METDASVNMEIWSLISRPLLLAVRIDFLEPNHLFSVWMGPIWYFITVEVRPVLCTVPFKEIATLLANKRQPMIINCRLTCVLILTFFLPICLVCTSCKNLIFVCFLWCYFWIKMKSFYTLAQRYSLIPFSASCSPQATVGIVAFQSD